MAVGSCVTMTVASNMTVAFTVAVAAIVAICVSAISMCVARLQALACCNGLFSVCCAVALGKHSEGVKDRPVACAAAAGKTAHLMFRVTSICCFPCDQSCWCCSQQYGGLGQAAEPCLQLLLLWCMIRCCSWRILQRHPDWHVIYAATTQHISADKSTSGCCFQCVPLRARRHCWHDCSG